MIVYSTFYILTYIPLIFFYDIDITDDTLYGKLPQLSRTKKSSVCRGTPSWKCAGTSHPTSLPSYVVRQT